MANSKPLPGAEKFTITAIISFIIVLVFCLLMMLWRGSYTRDANGKINYNTRVNEPSTSY